jgi:hypothetical protein
VQRNRRWSGGFFAAVVAESMGGVVIRSVTRRGVSLGHASFGCTAFAIERLDTDEARAYAVDQVSMNSMLGLCKAIMGVFGFPRDLDETSTPQIGEMSRYEWLRQVEQFDQVAHAEFSRSQKVQHAETRRVGKPAE